MNKRENRGVGELAKNQQGNGNARANIERATYTDGQKERGMDECREGRGDVRENKGRITADRKRGKKSRKTNVEKMQHYTPMYAPLCLELHMAFTERYNIIFTFFTANCFEQIPSRDLGLAFTRR